MAGRRGNIEETIRKRADGRWEGRILLDPGKHKCFYGRTRQEVARLVAQAIRDKNSDLPFVGTVKRLLTISNLGLKLPSTFRRYRNFVNNHVVKVI